MQLDKIFESKNTLLYIAIIAVVLVILIYILKPKSETQKAEDLTDAAKEQETQILQERKNQNLKNMNNLRDLLTDTKGLDPDFFKRAKIGTKITTQANANKIAKILYDELDATFNTDEAKIITTIANVKNLETLSQIANTYANNHARNLRADLLNHSFLIGESTNFFNILKKIPSSN